MRFASAQGAFQGIWGGIESADALVLQRERPFLGNRTAKARFAAFAGAGGKARFIQLPPYEDNGHSIFPGHPASCKAEFEAFLHQIGFEG